MRLLITGCARSATMYLAELLKAAGVDATHEKAQAPRETYNGSGYRIDPLGFDDSKAGEVEVNSEFGHVVEHVPVEALGHVIRHPHLVVASLVSRGLPAGHFGARHNLFYPELQHLSSVFDWSLAYWLAQNTRLHAIGQHHPHYQKFRIDDPLPALATLLEASEIPFDWGRLCDAYEQTPSDVNHDSVLQRVEYDWDSHDPYLKTAAEQLWREWTGEPC